MRRQSIRVLGKNGLFLLLLSVLIAGCAPATPGAGRGAADTGQTAPAAPKRLRVAILGNPIHLSPGITPASSVAGMHEVDQLVHAGLLNVDNRGTLIPQLAEAVPTSENGQWKVFPDGRMEATWKIGPNSRWHDGTPFTSADLLFTANVAKDPEIVPSQDAMYRLIERIEAPDPQTFRVTWSGPFISANMMFTATVSRSRPYQMPMPKHLLETPYAEDKTKMTDLPYWSDDFVGLGPFKLREFVRSSHFLFDAHDQYIFGRPKIDTIEVRFISGGPTVIANILSGTLDMVMGRELSLEQAVSMQDQWKDGRPGISYTFHLWMWPQFINPNPPIVTDVRLRRALLHAIDRQELVDSIMHGRSSVAHGMLDPADDVFKDTAARAVKYDYDPNRAIQMIAALGYVRGADGMFRDSAGQPLSMEIRSSRGETDAKTLFALSDYWKRVGIANDPYVIPQQQSEDREYRAKFPALAMQKGGFGPEQLPRNLSSQSPNAANRYSGPQLSGYSNAAFDAMIERYLVTIPVPERVQIFGDIIHHMTDQLTQIPLFYDVSVNLVSNRLVDLIPEFHKDATVAWNSHLWDVK